MPPPFCRQNVLASWLAAVAAVLLSSCRVSPNPDRPLIEFSRVPPAGEGSDDTLEPIEGTVKGARPGDRIVLFSRSGKWWIQPFSAQPFTAIGADSTWKNSTHPGTVYAALLVDSGYRPSITMTSLPQTGGPVLATATISGTPPPPLKTLQFSGYQWEIRNAPGATGDSKQAPGDEDAWTDQTGLLHLRIVKRGGRWSSSAMKLSRSLGYGSYRFVVRDLSHLEPAAVFALYTWDDDGPAREVDIEISRWGEPADKNAQYVVQPYVVPANTVRFTAPPGTLTFTIDWQPGKVRFRTVRGASSEIKSNTVAEHVFTSGIPAPGNERIHLNLYAFENRDNPLREGAEVIVEKFEFLP
jgi:hypothetical protein